MDNDPKEILKSRELEEAMSPGVYLITEGERRLVATLDDIIYGNVEDHREISHDLISIIRDIAVDLVTDEDDTTHRIVRLAIVQ